MSMGNKKIGLMLLLGLSIALAAMSVSAVTSNTPTTGDAINGTYTFNATAAIGATVNCTWATTGDGIFAITTNTSASQTEFLNSSNTASLTEAAATTLTITCANATATESTTASIDIDNTAPTCDFNIDLTAVNRQSGVGVSATDASSDTTDLTYSYSLTNDGGVEKATSTSQNPTFSNGDLEDIGEHTLTLTITDEVNKQSSCTEKFLVKDGEEDDAATTIGLGGKVNNSNLLFLGLIGGGAVVLIVAALAAVGVMDKKKKRK